VLSPAAVAVPTVVPPLVQVDGFDASGPNTVNVIVPVALDAPELAAKAPLIDEAAIALPAAPVGGAVTDSVGVALAITVSAIPAPHVLAAVLLLTSAG
jgi:hypothetical protein